MNTLWDSERDHIQRRAEAVAEAERTLQRERERLDDAMTNAIVGANSADVADVARAAGMSRQTVYQAMRRAWPTPIQRSG